MKCSQYLSSNVNELCKSHSFLYFVLNLGFIEITKLLIHKNFAMHRKLLAGALLDKAPLSLEIMLNN